jgi:hypothetical protein
LRKTQSGIFYGKSMMMANHAAMLHMPHVMPCYHDRAMLGRNFHAAIVAGIGMAWITLGLGEWRKRQKRHKQCCDAE